MNIFIYTIIFTIVQLFLLPLYNSFYLWLFSKTDFKPIKTITKIATILSPIILIILFWNFGSEIINPSIRSKEFNAELWINKPNERYKMVYDLKKNKLIGKEKTAVLKMLEKKDGSCGQNKAENTICYLTYDPENSFGIDHYELIIWFDEFDKVKRVTYEML